MARAAKAAVKKAAKAKKSADRIELATRAATLLKHVSDATRLQMVVMLSDGERHAGGLCEEVGLSPTAVSHHLTILRQAGIVVHRRQGNYVFYSLTDAGAELFRAVAVVLG